MGELKNVNNGESGDIKNATFPLDNRTSYRQIEGLSSDVKITILGQVHKLENNYCTEEECKEIEESQFTILKELKNNLGALIFLESISSDFTPELLINDGCNKTLSETANEIFPSGNVPNEFDLLTNEQKMFIRTIGGAETAFYLGLINVIHKTISEEDQNRIDSEVFSLWRNGLFKKGVTNPALATSEDFTDKGFDLIFTQREKCLEQEIIRVTNQPENIGKEVIVIFGKAHIKTLKERFKDNKLTIIDSTK